ncbi:MAG: hypothetical protein OES47_13680 [Acidobacteriota bacterium]|nr:hypothetical protein [Acidobacteriota bacterium]
MRLRDVTAPLLLAGVLLILLLLALATRYPEAEIVVRAEEWPVVGPAAQAFRARYVPSEVMNAEAGDTDDESGAKRQPVAQVEVIRVVDTGFLGVKPKVWAPRGTAIHHLPDSDSRVLIRLKRDFPLSRLRRDGDWYEVRFGNSTAGLEKGWVFLENYREPTAEELAAPAPVLPLPATAASEETVAVAREAMREGGTSGRCGEYLLWTDVEDPAVVAMCDRVGSRVDAAHRSRYELQPVSVAAETVFLFRDIEDYRAFRDRLAPSAHEDGHAYPALGYVAVAADRSLGALESILTHELAHLLNRRTLGPALPPWLDEGLARDFSLNGRLGGTEENPRRKNRFRLPTLPGQSPGLPLRELLELDQEDFQKRAARNYRAASRWIEHFLDSPGDDLRPRFLDFLGAIASGEPISEDLLLNRLGVSWAELEAGFAGWEQSGFAVTTTVSDRTTR